MEAAVDPLQPFLRLLGRYRQDVHYLRPPASAQAIPTAQAHLGEIPASLLDFLNRWNGATLFRGALRVRSISDFAPAKPDVPEVILFADGPKDNDRWGYAAIARNAVSRSFHFGRWDGEKLIPLHEDFSRWLLAQSRLLDENHQEEESQLRIRMEVDPDCGLLYLLAGEQLLASGDGDGALRAFRKANALTPELPSAWQRLGEALLSLDRAEATQALLMALRHSRMPLPYPGFPSIDRGLIRALEHQFPAGDPGWLRELDLFLAERCLDARPPEAHLLESATIARMRAHLGKHDRNKARNGLMEVLARAQTFTSMPELPVVRFALVSLHTDLGDHDAAEELLRPLRNHPDVQVRGRCQLALARIAHLREEPWAEEIAREALGLLKSAEDRCDALLLLAERLDPPSLEEATRLAKRLGDPIRLARCALVAGDQARDRGEKEAAVALYEETEADPESALRARVRLGDMDARGALAHYEAAIAGYRELQLPLREGWARVRLARYFLTMRDKESAWPHLDAARRIFTSTALAAGVAAVDRLRGETDLSWHLKLAAEYERQRHDAQRMRPPYVRADADRPERRLLAHRRAFAALDTRLVRSIAEDIRVELRQLQYSDSRVFGPAATRFVAMVDLLSGHLSFDAARELNELLKEEIPHDVAARALIGAMARSPNMSLIALLVDALTTLTEPAALARTIEVLGWRRETEAVPRLMHYVEAGSLPVRRAAVTALGRIGDPRATSVLLPCMDLPELAEATAVALLLLGEWQGVDYHGQAMARGTTSTLSAPGEIVGRFGGPSYLLLLYGVAEREGPAGLGALRGLGLLGSVKAIPRLIDAVGSRDPARQNTASAALTLLTGHVEDPEAPHPRQRWEQWWQGHSDRMAENLRWRHGHPLTVRALIDLLGHDDLGVRQSAYDELVISTGLRQPFDADGPWRMQLAHREAWQRWYADNAHYLPQTGWLFHGRSVG